MLNRISHYLAVLHRRAALKNHTFSIISNSCIGGVIAHSVGEQFRSPTVNLIIYEHDFLTFCENLRAYSRCKLEMPPTDQFDSLGYPVGILRGETENLPDITLYFVHYKTFEEARDAWIKRFRRINYDNLFVLMDRGMDASDEILDRFYRLDIPNKVFFTHKEDPIRWPNNFRFTYYTPERYQSGYLYTFLRKGLLAYRVLDEFDYVHWLNTGVIRRNPIFHRS